MGSLFEDVLITSAPQGCLPPPSNREGFVSVMKMLRSEGVKKASCTCIYNVVNGAEVVSHIEVKMTSWRIMNGLKNKTSVCNGILTSCSCGLNLISLGYY